jgi:hypothetical protein
MRTEYNLPQAMSRMQPVRLALAFFLALAATAHASPAQAAERGQIAERSGRWDAQVSAFAKKIAAISGPATATLEMRNISALTSEQAAAVGRMLELQMRANGVQIRGEHEASIRIRVTFSDNQRGLVWIAEVQQGPETRVAMIEVAEERAPGAAHSALPFTLQSALLLSSPEVLLDVQPLTRPPGTLAALTTHSVALYEQQGGRWQQVREVPIALQLPLPRDPRGRIVPAQDHSFDLYLPGGSCGAAADTANVALNCIASDDPWPLAGQSAFYNSARNYFTGVLAPGVGRPIPPFFSAAPLGESKSVQWLFARVDGRASIFDRGTEHIVSGAARTWGSDIAAVHTGCASGTQLLASESGLGTPTDSLQAFEIAGSDAQPASAPLKFNGPITALWAAPEASTATVVVHTPQGGYDAYSVSLACNQ